MALLIWQDALFAYDNAIALDPSFANAYMKKAKLLAQLGRRTEAENIYATALKINPYSVYIYDERAKLRMLAKDYKGALEDLNRAVDIAPNNVLIRDHLIDDLIALEFYEEALQEIDSLLANGYQIVRELEKKALVLLLTKEIDLCEEILLELLSIDGRSAFAHDLLGVVYLTKNQPSEALTEFNKALSIDSMMVVAYHNRALAHRLLNDKESAMEDLNRALDIRQDLERIYYSRAIVKKEMGNVDAALNDYDRAIKINSEFDDALYNRAYTLKLMGNYAGAMSELEELLFSNPESAEAWNMKGNIKVLYAQYFEAISDYNQAISLNQDFGTAYYNRGLAKLMNNQFTDGCQDLEQALSLDFEKADIKLNAFCR
ncbi:MAG: tetratricopeptide repeat protein [Flavobacteriales bacterium]|nr:tetratricopeptide repeat protein [Flavobacteriales bacterium]MCB9191925.1 tetratricopeptide repeat protein [Flavobacteriales bacterium]